VTTPTTTVTTEPRYPDNSSIVGQLRTRRRTLEISQRTLGEKTGIGHGHLSRIESGYVAPSLETVERIAAALDVALGIVDIPPTAVAPPGGE
jgi:transcriptional regulator with XRE-family HTH domain